MSHFKVQERKSDYGNNYIGKILFFLSSFLTEPALQKNARGLGPKGITTSPAAAVGRPPTGGGISVNRGKKKGTVQRNGQQSTWVTICKEIILFFFPSFFSIPPLLLFLHEGHRVYIYGPATMQSCDNVHHSSSRTWAPHYSTMITYHLEVLCRLTAGSTRQQLPNPWRLFGMDRRIHRW